MVTLVAVYLVTSPPTIHPGLNREILLEFVGEHALELPASVVSFLESGLGPISLGFGLS